MGGQSSGGNRQDNRQRGNAAQLLEKYKSMARDSQLAGDRVQTEYYLQFADHYFRVLSESRSRFEDQRPRSRDDEDSADDGDEDMLDDGDETTSRNDGNYRDDQQQGEPQQRRGRDYEDRGPRRDRPQRSDRNDGQRPRYNRDDRDARDDEDRPSRGGRNGAEQLEQSEERIAFDVLPPAIGQSDGGDAPEASAEEAPRPRRRTVRKPKPEADGEILPTA